MSEQKIRVSQDKNALPAWPPEEGFYFSNAASLLCIDGKQFVLCNGNNTLLFRFIDRNVAGWTYFVYDSADHNAYTLDAAWFAKQYQAKQFGRVIAVPVTAEPDCERFERLYFRTDGTGFIWPGKGQTEFSWAELWEWPLNVLNESTELMSYLGRIVFDKFNATLKNPIIDPRALKDEPLEFINGSREELETITRWICHSGVGRPDGPSDWNIDYSAPDILLGRDGGISQWQFNKSPSLQELFILAYEYNSFTGFHWEYNDNRSGHRDSYDPEPVNIEFSFPLATHDEQRAAKLELRRWLGGKITQEEIQHLLGHADTP